jgi:hypothetical protein
MMRRGDDEDSAAVVGFIAGALCAGALILAYILLVH